MADMVEASLDVALQYPFGRTVPTQPSVQGIDSVRRTPVSSESVGVGIRFRSRNRFQCHQIQCLHGSVLHGRYSERSHFSVAFGYVDPFQGEIVASPFQRTHCLYLHGIGIPLDVVNPCRAFTFIGCHFPYCQDFGFMGSDEKMLQGFHLVVSSFFLSLCYSDLQLVYLALTFGKVYVFPKYGPLG